MVSFAILEITGTFLWFVLMFSIVMCLMLIGWRVSLRLLLRGYRKKGRNLINVVIIGTGDTAKYIYEEMTSDVSAGFRVLGFFSNDLKASRSFKNYLGRLDKLPKFFVENRIDEIYYTLPITTGEHLRPIASFAKEHMINFFVIPDFSRILKRKIDMAFLGNVPLFKYASEPLAKKNNRFTKRICDIIFSSLVIILTYPLLFMIVGLLIKLTSPGPIIFKQERTGLRGGNFACYKFRTMRKNEEADSLQATKNDKRITPIGAFLRKTNLDEMPQFINVIKGDMSVVGPRPHMTAHTDEYSQRIDRYMFRHMVKPGITGWAQVNGFRGETAELADMEGRVEHDVWYIENWSVLLDINIIIRTVWNTIRGEKKAY
jgi:putative colanic acid biosynthesis UDP-glucose lipid carrier transferase